MPEYFGKFVFGLVFVSVDPELREKMKENYCSVGIISSRTGAAGQITAVDDAVKETNTEVLSMLGEMEREVRGLGESYIR